MNRKSFLSGYRALAVIALNAILLLAAVNFILSFYFSIRDREAAGNLVLNEHGSSLMAAYPQQDQATVRQLLDETWNRDWQYVPYVEFMEQPFKGRYVNVSEFGFRDSGVGNAWPPAEEVLNIFVFGGSTVFGYGVADKDTIPANLQSILSARLERNVAVYNFGQSGWISQQERALFFDFLQKGIVPDLAIFVDGLNDFGRVDGSPWFTEAIATAIHEHKVSNASDLLEHFALGRAALAAKQRIASVKDTPNQQWKSLAASGLSDKESGQVVLDRYLRNREQIQLMAESYGTEALFIWQPVPMYQYDREYYPFQLNGFPGSSVSIVQAGYEIMDKTRNKIEKDSDFVWLADKQSELDIPLYVDRWHYSAEFSRLLAMRIADEVLQRTRLIETAVEMDSSSSAAQNR